MQTDFNLLLTFQTVARTGSIKATAALLGLTPSAVSQALAKLEAQIGSQLFLREHKKIRISTKGNDLLTRVTNPLLALQHQLDEFKDEAGAQGVSGTVSLGCPSEFGSSFVIEWYSALRKIHPAIKAKLRLGSPRTLLKHLESGEVDFLIVDDGPYYESYTKTLAIEPFVSEELVLCISPSLQRKNRGDARFESLVRLPHLDYSTDGSAIGIWYKHFFGKIPKNLEVAMISENVRALINGVKNDLGVAMVPKYLIQKELTKGLLLEIRPSGAKPLKNGILLVQHQSKIPSKAEKIFLQFLRSKRNMIF